ncbi:hypothetical protein ANRL1_03809 [Anaerolineae bacterium]|nr:hypothetical protein ANRL1_03809 [Anaerolineae bacterium]
MTRAMKCGGNNHDTMGTGQSSAEIQQTILNHLHYTQAKPLHFATRIDLRCQAANSKSLSLFEEPHYEHATC